MIQKTVKIPVKTTSVLDFCREYEIPHLKCCQKNGVGKNGKKNKYFEKGCIPEKFADWNYDQCEEWNESIIFEPTHINVLLGKSTAVDKFMVVDFDSKEDLDLLSEFGGENWVSRSSNRKLPHLWRLRNPDDYSKCTTSIKLGERKTAIDLKYSNIIETIDSQIEYHTGNHPEEFEFERLHPKPINGVPPPNDEKRKPSASYTTFMSNHLGKRFINHLRNINHTEYTSNYTDWFKIGNAIKRVFSNPEQPDLWFDILCSYSRLSPRHQSEDEEAWRPMFEGDSICGISTILQYSKNSNKDRYDEIEKEYQSVVQADAEAERKVLLECGFKMLMDYMKEYEDGVSKPTTSGIEEPTASGIADPTASGIAEPTYKVIKSEFEKNHAKIVEKAIFITEKDDGDVIIMSRSKLKDAYEHLKYVKYVDDKPIKKSFISTWLNDQYLRKYEDFGIYPPPLAAPNGIYNLWKPFAVSKHTGEYERDENGLKQFLNHVKILCGNDDKVTDYIVKWIAQMFQYPAVKTIAPTFISQEGAGKGTLIDFIAKLMGEKKIIESTAPSRDVWGNFNTLMSGSFFVNLNEMCKREAVDAEGKIKGLITDARLTINKKNQDPYVIQSYHRFLITSNKPDPINTKEGDRRNLIIVSSNEKIEKTAENVEYFNELRRAYADLRTQRTVYDYLMAIPDMDKFNSIPMPKTEYQNDMKELNRDIYDRFVEHLVIGNQDDVEVKLYGDEQNQLFKKFCQSNGFEYESSSVKTSLGIKRLNLKGVQSSVKTRKGFQTIYNILELKQHYMVGCLIDI